MDDECEETVIIYVYMFGLGLCSAVCFVSFRKPYWISLYFLCSGRQRWGKFECRNYHMRQCQPQWLVDTGAMVDIGRLYLALAALAR